MSITELAQKSTLTPSEMDFINGWIEDFLAKVGRSRLSINFLELTTVLTQRQIVKPFFTIDHIPFQPNSSITINNFIPLGQVSIVAEVRLSVSQDNAFAMIVQLDNDEPVFNDPTVRNETYQFPVNFFHLGDLLPAFYKVTITITNNTSAPQTVHLAQFGVRMGKPFWDTLVAKYFEVIEGEIYGKLP
jgi:hypothetical protein